LLSEIEIAERKF